MKRLLILVPSLAVEGGLEKVARMTATVARNRYEIFLVCFYGMDAPIPENVRCFCLNEPPGNTLPRRILTLLRRNRKLRQLKKEINPDYSFSIGETASISNLLTKKNEISCIASIHGFSSIPVTFFKKRFTSFCFRKADRIVCVSRGIKDAFRAAVSLPSRMFSVLYNPFPAEEMIRKNVPIRLENKAHAKKIFCIGRLESYKNIELAIQAVAILKSHMDVSLYLVGSGPWRSALETFAKQCGAADHVLFLGVSNNPSELLQNADALLVCSWNEGFGNTIVEALACGVPVISVDCQFGPREILAPCSNPHKTAIDIEKEEFGILLPPSHHTDTFEQRSTKAATLARAITLLFKDRSLADRYRRDGLKRALDFDIKIYMEKLQQLLGE